MVALPFLERVGKFRLDVVGDFAGRGVSVGEGVEDRHGVIGGIVVFGHVAEAGTEGAKGDDER